jgi:hypothetical protein
MSDTTSTRSMNMDSLEGLADLVLGANHARLDGRLSREHHALVISDVDDKLIEHGWSWEELGELIPRVSE